MIVGFHSPLPPARTGVADYSASLLSRLRTLGRVEVGASAADVHLYHLGNNQLHRAIYQRALLRPGVVVLHDAVLQHFFLGALSQPAYLDEYVYNYGEWERPVAEQLWRDRASSGSDIRYFQRPMLKRIAERSLAVIVHNAAAAASVRAHAPQARIVEIPHLFDGPLRPDPSARDIARSRWDLDATNFLFGVFGYLRESKRLIPVLQAFERLHVRLPGVRLLLAGAFASPDLERAVQPWLAHPAVFREPHLPERDFWKIAAAVDCCLNLRHPAAGETSGIGVRLMGLGQPVFFSDGPEIGRIPQHACFRVSPGLEENAELFEYMYVAARHPQLARAVGERGAAHIREHHSLAGAADRYWKTLCAVCASAP